MPILVMNLEANDPNEHTDVFAYGDNVMKRNYRKEHEAAESALKSAKERSALLYNAGKRVILFKKVNRDGGVRVGFKDYDSCNAFRMIPLNDVVELGIDIDSLPEYTDFSERYRSLLRAARECFNEAKNKSRFAMRSAKTDYLSQFYAVRREVYDSYILSREWQVKRQECFDHHGLICVDCGLSEATDIHHIHYETLGDECPVNDLVPLCNTCHEQRHMRER